MRRLTLIITSNFVEASERYCDQSQMCDITGCVVAPALC